jgi:hypothetical protein
MNRVAIPSLLTLLFAQTLCLGMGSDHKSGDLPPHDGWPKGVYDAVNQPNRVHGYWINSSDTLFYKGSNAELQEMTCKLTQARCATVEVVLHAGTGVAKSPWSKDRIDTADWSLTIAGDDAITKTQDKIRIDVWLGGSVTLADLRLPPTVTVKSGGEIESFIKRHGAAP